jgi:hypothetical protein
MGLGDEKKWGQTDTHTHTQTTPTRGRIIVADGIYSVGDKKITVPACYINKLYKEIV